MANENIIKLSEGFGEGTIGDVLTLKDENTVGWQTPQGGGSTYTPGSMIQIDNDTINIKNNNCSATGNYAIAVGYETSAIGDYSHTEGRETSANGKFSHAEGSATNTIGSASHAEGYSTTASADYSHAEGEETQALDRSSHAEGYQTSAHAGGSHAEGRQTITTEQYSHAEGYGTIASGGASHTEGGFTYTYSAANYGHAEGYLASAIGFASHAEGKATKAIGNYSHTEGGYTIANDQFMHAAGKYNATSADALFVIGNGTDSKHRSDAFIVYPNGQAGATDFITNGVSLSGMLALYDVLTARPLAGSYTLKCVDGVLTWEGEVPSNAVSVNGEQVGVNNEGFGINDNPSPTPGYNYIILQNFLDGHTIGTPIPGDSSYSDFYNTYPSDISTLWYSVDDWSDNNLVSTTAGDQLLYSDNSFDFSKYGLTTGQVPFGFCKIYDIYHGAGYDNITLPSEWTFESWFYTPNNDPWYGSFFEIGPDDSNLIKLFIYSGSISLFAMNNEVINISKTVTSQAWHHVSLSCDGTNLYLFYDGELLGTVAIASVSGLSTMLASALKVMVNVDSGGYGANSVWYAQIALCDECKWTDDFVPPKYAY